MLSKPMPDAANPSRTREAALSVAARLMRETEQGKVHERMDRIKKRQKTSEQIAEDTKVSEEEPGSLMAIQDKPGCVEV